MNNTIEKKTDRQERIYYFNTKELMDNKFGTPNPVPFRVVDSKIGLDVDVSIRCSGVYSYRIADPLLFYTRVCGNVTEAYTRDRCDKCGWEPEDPTHPPKFCPECGDVFDDNDVK